MPTHRRHSRCIQALLAIVGVLLAFPLRSDEVNLSHYKLSVTVGASEEVIEALDESVMAAFCRDDNGCTINLRQLRTEFATAWRLARTTLYRGPGATIFVNKWQIEGFPALHGDTDTVSEPVLEINDGGIVCSIEDGDDDVSGTPDDNAGFSLRATNVIGFSITCNLTVVD